MGIINGFVLIIFNKKTMKKLILPILILATISAFSQVDSSKLSISVVLKQKFIAYMAQKVSLSNTIADANYRDSLVKYIGSGTSLDSQVTTHFSSGLIFKLVQNLLSEVSGTSYSTIYELGNGATGYTGLIAQLFTKASTQNSETGVSKWLFVQIENLLSYGQLNMSGLNSTGILWLHTPIIYN